MAENKTRIYRETKVDNYSVIHNQVLRRKDLSWKAKGIMCYILSLPNDWIIYLEELMQHSTDQITSFRSGWKELQQAGYVRRYPVKNEKGVIIEWRTEVREYVDITTPSPQSGFPLVDDPQVDNPLVENQQLLSTNNTKYLNKLNTDNTKTCQPSSENDNIASESPLKKKEVDDVPYPSEVIEALYNQPPSGLLAQTIYKWVQTRDKSMINHAIELARAHTVELRRIESYVNVIFKKWEEKGITTVEQAKEDSKKFKEKNTKPSYQKTSAKQEVVPKWLSDQQREEQKPKSVKQAEPVEAAVSEDVMEARLQAYLKRKEEQN